MTLQSGTVISLFDKYNLTIPPELKWHQDGLPGKRVLFITDQKETFNISFEEGINMLDILEGGDSTVSYQYCKNGKCIYLKRNSSDKITCAFFCIEFEGDKSLLLHGQMVLTSDYKWSDGVEPVLIELLEGFNVCK